MSDLNRERCLSIFPQSASGWGTVEGRINGVIAVLEVGMPKPIFGHGLGNSREANANFRGEDMLSHDLYTEIAEELGVVGLGIFLSVILEFVRNCYAAKKVANATPAKSKDLEFL